eukprot:GILJ01007729.1.p1 GENE.GILJ01007729.1~~GILJ01007729.1.p1  ORF type:complete len:424 (-),score=49.67 GILJ01007729.1:118-1389(-)
MEDISAEPVVEARHRVLGSEYELRLELNFDQQVELKVTRGTAEVFGTELAIGVPYIIKGGMKIAIFTWHGCSLSLKGQCAVEYEATETPMVSYINTHQLIEDMRQDAQASGQPAPRVMIVGPTDTGKSTLSRILLNYAFRAGRKPMFVDLDVGQGDVTIPGCLSLVPIEQIIDLEEGFGKASALTYFFGHQSIQEGVEFYTALTSRLAEVLNEALDAQPHLRQGGVIINTSSWVDGPGYELLTESIRRFQVDLILVLDQERLSVELRKAFPDKQVIKLAKSGGVVSRDINYRKRARVERFKDYFYGKEKELCPHQTMVDLTQNAVYKIGGTAAPSTALPIGAKAHLDPVRPVQVTSNPTLLHSILAVLFAESADQIPTANAAGFVCVTSVDEHVPTRVVCLAPSPGALPSKFLLMGSLKWLEQ